MKSTSTGNSGNADRNPDGTFTKGSDLAKELGAQGGHASHGATDSTSNSSEPGRNPDGTFTKGSEVASKLGAEGGHASHGSSNDSSAQTSSNESGVSCPEVRSMSS